MKKRKYKSKKQREREYEKLLGDIIFQSPKEKKKFLLEVREYIEKKKQEYYDQRGF